MPEPLAFGEVIRFTCKRGDAIISSGLDGPAADVFLTFFVGSRFLALLLVLGCLGFFARVGPDFNFIFVSDDFLRAIELPREAIGLRAVFAPPPWHGEVSFGITAAPFGDFSCMDDLTFLRVEAAPLDLASDVAAYADTLEACLPAPAY